MSSALKGCSMESCKLFDKMLFGYAYHKLIYNESGNAADYIFLDVNESFEKLTGLKKDEILNRKVTEVLPGIKDLEFDWIGIYARAARTGESIRFEQYFAPLNKWFSISACSDKKDYFAAFFEDISEAKLKDARIKMFSDMIIKYLKFPCGSVDYKLITDDMLALSGAKYTVINIYDINNKTSVTRSVSGNSKEIGKFNEIWGKSLDGCVWSIDDPATKVLMEKNINRFKGISGINTIHLEKDMAQKLDAVFNIGNIYTIGIRSGKNTVGNLLFIMDKNQDSIDEKIIEVYAGYIGNLVGKNATEETLRKSEGRYKQLIELAQEGIWTVDKDQNTTYINNKVERMLGYMREEIIGKPFYDYIVENQKEDYKKNILKSRHEKAEKINCDFITKDGRTLKAVLETSPLTDAADNYTGSIVSLVDVTEQKSMEQELIRAKEAAEAANNAKSEFLANMSHELRTPLNVILGTIDLVMMEDMSVEIRKLLKMSKNAAVALKDIINCVLDISKIEAGKLTLEKKEFDLIKVIRGTFEFVSSISNNKKIQMINEIQENVPVKVIGDRLRLRQILINLVGNAVKFTETGSVCLTVEKEQQDGNIVRVGFKIKDTGIGIPEDKLTRLFKSFNQIDNSLTKKHQGTGLGLSISKALVELLGGSIRVESQENAGSTFYFNALFELPKDEFQPNFNNLLSIKPLTDEKRGVELLLVDDNKDFQELARLMIKKKGWYLETADNGLAAVELVKSKKFDVILMDIQMPSLDGFGATQIIRQMEKKLNYYTPIIGVTAYAMSGYLEKCLVAGMDGYLSKPFNINEFYNTIDKWVK